VVVVAGSLVVEVGSAPVSGTVVSAVSENVVVVESVPPHDTASRAAASPNMTLERIVPPYEQSKPTGMV
jgi:hypothetical protein